MAGLIGYREAEDTGQMVYNKISFPLSGVLYKIDKKQIHVFHWTSHVEIRLNHS
jgi:hypothetical protein